MGYEGGGEPYYKQVNQKKSEVLKPIHLHLKKGWFWKCLFPTPSPHAKYPIK